MADRSRLKNMSDQQLHRTGADNRRSAKRAERFDMPDAAEHWRGEYDAVLDEFRERDAARDQERRP